MIGLSVHVYSGARRTILPVLHTIFFFDTDTFKLWNFPFREEGEAVD